MHVHSFGCVDNILNTSIVISFYFLCMDAREISVDEVDSSGLRDFVDELGLMGPDPENFNIVAQQRSYLESDRKYVHAALRNAVKNLFSQEGIKTSENLLEIGSGIGFFSTLVPGKFRKNILQTDPSQEALDEAKKQYPEGNYRRLDACAMYAIPSSSVDRVFGLNVLNYVGESRRKRIVQEAHRVLKPGGAFYALSDLQPNENSIVAALAREAGIPLAYAKTSTQNRKGIQYVAAIDTRVETPLSAGILSMLGGGDRQYHPTGIYFSENVVDPLFRQYFVESEVGGIVGSGSMPILWPACLVRQNTYARIYDVLSRSPSRLMKKNSRHVDFENEIEKARCGKLRRLELAVIEMNKGVK